jgi:F420-non-reducing hydrogenase small subunit
MIAALASVIDAKDPGDIDRILDGVVDPIGTFYRFSLATATLAGVNGSVTTREGKLSPERVAL